MSLSSIPFNEEIDNALYNNTALKMGNQGSIESRQKPMMTLENEKEDGIPRGRQLITSCHAPSHPHAPSDIPTPPRSRSDDRQTPQTPRKSTTVSTHTRHETQVETITNACQTATLMPLPPSPPGDDDVERRRAVTNIIASYKKKKYNEGKGSFIRFLAEMLLLVVRR